ncbi:MAG TPA: DUF4115 domain-containing protein, partial [Burkholderiaceae bacterium]|nr:DUF4115 domain-containing protein [Burkholderiaceae bacterium]
LKAPFHDRPGREAPAEDRLWHRPVFWLVAALLLAAVGFVLWPQLTSLWAGLPSLPHTSAGDISPAPVAKAPPEPLAPASVPEAPVVTAAAPVAEAASGGVGETVHAADAGASPAADAPPAGIAVVRASGPSWVEARDARGNLLMSRTLQPGEVVGLDGVLPLKLVIGNAPATEVTLRGKRVVLGAPNRENVVRIELK